MVQIQQRFLILSACAVIVSAEPLRFYPDDPLERIPDPVRVETAKRRSLHELYDFALNSFVKPGVRQNSDDPTPAQAINTLGEVPDSAWYANRHGARRMSLGDLVRGAGTDNAPAKEGVWTVFQSKAEGVTPGFRVRDTQGRRYVFKMDPKRYPELASAADVVGAKFFHALGYNVPENYIVTFRREQLVPDPKGKFVDSRGRERPMTPRDLDDILKNAPRDAEGRYRALASFYLPGELLGPFRFHGVRSDDPNDITPHEHRRDLRGLHVFCAWLGHNDAKSLNTQDSLLNDGPFRYIRHYLIDFGASLGSDSFTIKSPRAGNEYLIGWKPAAVQMLSLGFVIPDWAKADFPVIPSAGRFESHVFEPERWTPNYRIPAFRNRLPDDEFWAAKQVMAFRDDEIRALVGTGEYSDSRAVDHLTRVLIERRDKIGRCYFAKVLPLDQFQVRNGRLEFVDLGVTHGFASPREYKIRWSRFENGRGRTQPIPGEGPAIPASFAASPAGSFAVAAIEADDPEKQVIAYLRKDVGGVNVVGLERTW